MIAVIMIILGIVLAAGGLLLMGYTSISPVVVKLRSVNGSVEPEETELTRNTRSKDRKWLISFSFTMLLIGLFIAVAGWFWGFAESGDGMWMFNSGKQVSWDNITADGKYAADDGKEYSFYLVVSGNSYEFCGEPLENTDALKKRIEGISGQSRMNTVVVIDNYAVSDSYKAAVDILEDYGMSVKEEES